MARATSPNSTVLSFTVTKITKELLDYRAKDMKITTSTLVRDIIADYLFSQGLLLDKHDALIERGTLAQFTHASPTIANLRRKILQERMARTRSYIKKNARK